MSARLSPYKRSPACRTKISRFAEPRVQKGGSRALFLFRAGTKPCIRLDMTGGGGGGNLPALGAFAFINSVYGHVPTRCCVRSVPTCLETAGARSPHSNCSFNDNGMPYDTNKYRVCCTRKRAAQTCGSTEAILPKSLKWWHLGGKTIPPLLLSFRALRLFVLSTEGVGFGGKQQQGDRVHSSCLFTSVR